jgi:hypothetical protein
MKILLLFQFLFQIRHGRDHIIKGCFQRAEGIMNLIGDDRSLGRWSYDAVMFKGSQRIPDDVLGLAGELRQSDDADRSVISNGFEDVDMPDKKVKFLFSNIGNRSFITMFFRHYNTSLVNC